MRTLLVEVIGNMTFNRTIFPPHLLVYNDLLIYKKRRLFSVREITISYNQIAEVILTMGIFFASFEIETKGDAKILIRFAPKKASRLAKTIIDQKIYHAHAKHQPTAEKDTGLTNQYERSLIRLNELLSKDKITQREYDKAKEELLRKMS